MDDFTQRMLARAHQRQKKLGDELTDAGLASVERRKPESSKECPGRVESPKSDRTRVSSDIPASPKSVEKTLNIQRDRFNMEIKLTTADDMRVEVEIEERDEDETPAALRDDVKDRLQRLGKLYSGCDEIPLSSPIHRTEGRFDVAEGRPARSQPRSRRLAALADTINQWEDDLHSSRKDVKRTADDNQVKKSWKPPAPKPPTEQTGPGTAEGTSKERRTEMKRSTKPPAPKAPAPTPKTPAPKTPTPKTPVPKTPTPKTPAPKTPKKDEDRNEDNPIQWDKNVLDSLESQGYIRTESTSRLVYDYQNLESGNVERRRPVSPVPADEIEPKTDNDNKSPVKAPKNVSPSKKYAAPSESILNMAAKFETATSTSPATKKDPALLPLSERKALFENRKGEALVPRAPFAMSVPANFPKKQEKVSAPGPKRTTAEFKENVSCENVVKPTTIAAESSNIASKLQALLKRANTISETQIMQARQQERRRELEMLKNRFSKNKEIVERSEVIVEESSEDEEAEASETTKMIPDVPKTKIVTFGDGPAVPSAPPMPVETESDPNARHKRRSGGDSPRVKAVLEDVKRVKISPTKEGRLYPCLSDIETATEQENGDSSDDRTDENSFGDSSQIESDVAETSFGREIMRAVCRTQGPVQKRRIADDSADSSDLSDVLNDMNEYLDQNVSDDSDAGPTPPKYKKKKNGVSPSKTRAEPSDSFHYKKCSPKKENYTNDGPTTPVTDLPTHVIDEGTPVPLMHTVSFYRRQQSQGSKTPVRQIQRPATLIESPPSEDSYVSDADAEEYLVEEKIRQLQDEINKQQIVISQASQALNLCCSTIEFSGSSEQVEAERLLLVATHRRHSAMLEAQRLKIERTLRPGGGANAEKVDTGTVSMTDIVLPLKRDYVRALTTAGGLGHHLMCLVRYAERVVPTAIVATGNPPGPPRPAVRIPGTIKLEHVYADFTITLEVYSMHAHEEILPHEIKYHIGNGKKGTKLLTPKSKKHESKLIMPPVQSPAGPNAVRTTSFTMIGYVVFSIREISRSQWTLNKVPIASPLDGTVQMKVDCELSISVETDGFLTMFEDVSGFGAWHRRWCRLKGHVVNYWKYPDDEKKKAPIGTIDLRGCVTRNVGVVSRDICARPNTFLLEFVRPRRPSDTNSLVTVVDERTTTLRHLLSADTKEERIHWCRLLNKSLSAMKSWGANNQ